MRIDWQEGLEPGVEAIVVLKAIGKLFLQVPPVAILVILCTMGVWLSPVTYLLLRTWLLGQGPLFMWIVLGIGAALFLAGMNHFVGWTIRMIPYRSEVLKAKRSGQKVRIDLALDAWHIRNRRRKFWPLWMALFSTFLIIPAWVALTLANHPPAPRASDGTKVQSASQDRRVRALIKEMEGRIVKKPR